MEVFREILYSAIFWIMAAILLVTVVYPWRPEWRGARRWVHLPVLLLPLWLIYEIAMPPEMNIRVDLLLIMPGILLALVIYGVKLLLFRRRAAEVA